MTDLRRRYIEDMTLHGLAPTTQKVYVHAVEKLSQHYDRSPALLSEQELRDYFVYLVEKKRAASRCVVEPPIRWPTPRPIACLRPTRSH